MIQFVDLFFLRWAALEQGKATTPSTLRSTPWHRTSPHTVLTSDGFHWLRCHLAFQHIPQHISKTKHLNMPTLKCCHMPPVGKFLVYCFFHQRNSGKLCHSQRPEVSIPQQEEAKILWAVPAGGCLDWEWCLRDRVGLCRRKHIKRVLETDVAKLESCSIRPPRANVSFCNVSCCPEVAASSEVSWVHAFVGTRFVPSYY